MQLSFSRAEHFAWQPHLKLMASKSSKAQVAAVLIVVGLVAAFTYPIWFPVLTSILNPANPNAQVVISCAISDGLTDLAFTPAGSTAKFYVWPYGATAPYTDTVPLVFIAAGTETPDGTYTSTGATVAVGTWVLVYIADSGNTYYTASVIRQVKPLYGYATVSYLDPIKVYPRSATGAAGYGQTSGDKTASIMTNGALVTNATGVATGATTMQVNLAITSAKSWGSAGYVDPTTGYWYNPGFIIFDLDKTTARATIDTTTNMIWHGVIGVHEYWCFNVGQQVNDADVATDGIYSFNIQFTNQAAAADVLTIGFYTARRPSLIQQGSFGTTDLVKAENLYQIHLN